ncbi:3-hydroxyacyl-ACP dehydratase FabZ family protein [Gemmatimonas aurantiaca]|uniref:3-hydroxyacyl-ACP dehydratase FabZ family protein n=1 Tax=Gemmatimonas aurantiaca TaxID=173480 RepID=UPI00301D3FC2
MSVMNPLELLPHRYPFLLLDRIDEVRPGHHALGSKLVTGSEWSTIGMRADMTSASPRRAMPHMLIVESLAQLTAAVLVGLMEDGGDAIGYFMGIDRSRFRGEARPGDVLALRVDLLQFRRGICRTRGIAMIDGRRIVQADLTTVLRPAPRPAPKS